MEDLAQFSALIDRIYQGATDTQAWPGIVEILALWMKASKGLVFTPMNDPRSDGFAFPYGITESTLVSWASVHMPQDLWRNRAAERGLLRNGRVMLDADMATDSELLASAWYRDFLAPAGIGRVLSGLVFEAGHASLPMTAVSLFRAMEEPPYTEQDRARFQTVFPHVSRALGVMMTLRDAEFRVSASQAGLDRLSAGVLLLDAQGAVSFANAAAKDLLAARDGISLRTTLGQVNPQLVIHSAELSQTVIAAINMALARDIDVDLFHKTHVIARPSGAAPYSLQVSALSGQPCFGTTGSVPSAIVFIVNPELGVRLDARQLQDLYRLTPAEARVAVQLSEGEDLTQLAAMLGVSINTVKSQIRNIYEKMGIDSRAAFLRAAMSHSTVQIGFVAQRPVGRR